MRLGNYQRKLDNMARGKVWEKEKVTELLKPILQRGYSVRKACQIAGIPQQTVQTWLSEDEELRLQFTAWQHHVDMIATDIVVDSITKTKDLTMAKWWKERREKDMAPMSRHAGPDGEALQQTNVLKLIHENNDDDLSKLANDGDNGSATKQGVADSESLQGENQVGKTDNVQAEAGTAALPVE